MFVENIHNFYINTQDKTANPSTMLPADTSQLQNQLLIENLSHQNNKYVEEDSGFKAWQNDSSLIGQNQTNLLRNFKSQLLIYEEKYKKLDSSKTIPIKLPALDYVKNKKSTSKNNHTSTNNNNIISAQQNALTQRKHLQSPHTQNLYKHKSIQINKKAPSSKQSRRPTCQKSRNQSRNKNTSNNTIDQAEQKNQPILITKVQQMKFSQNQKRIRKRDLYLAIFGERGKGKVQKIQFDDQNQAYHCYLERRNQQAKIPTVVSPVMDLDKHKIRCSNQLNHRNLPSRSELASQSTNLMSKNTNHLPMRY